MRQRPGIEEVRERLRAHGYLDTGLERAIFTAPRASGAIGPSVAAGAIACAAASAAAAAVRGAAGIGGALALFAALLIAELPVAAAGGAAIYAITRILRVPRNPRLLSMGAAAAAAAAPFFLFTLGVRSLPAGGRGPTIVPVVLVALAAFYFARAIRATILSLLLRRMVDLPERPYFRIGAATAVAVVLAASLLVWKRPRTPVPPPPLSVSSAPRAPMVVIGLDGVAPAELAGLGLPAPIAVWRRPAAPPPEVWTTIATGVDPERHGVRAFERILLFGAASLRPPLGTAWAVRGPLRWAGVASRLPVSGAQRRALTFWEVAARAGESVVAVNWWASSPIPGAAVVDNAEIALRSRSAAEDDAEAIRAFERERAARAPALATVYLPGADIARGLPTEPARAFLLREAERARYGAELVWVVADSGRSGRTGGLAVIDPEARPGARAAAGAPTDVAPSVLARLGLPVAGDLDGVPMAAVFAPDALETRSIATYGSAHAGQRPERSGRAGREYLERLRSLGYLK